LLLERPSIFGPTGLIRSLEEVKGLGFGPSLATFGASLIAKKCMSKTCWDEKVDVFEKRGWSDEVFSQAFRLQSSLMLASVHKFNLDMSFWANLLG
jgi:mTERF domain-containing protein, mitochondrial